MPVLGIKSDLLQQVLSTTEPISIPVKKVLKKECKSQAQVVQAFNPSTQKGEAGASL